MTIPSRKRRTLIVAACLAAAGSAIGVVSITRMKSANRARQERAAIEQASRTTSRALEGSCEVHVPRHPPAAGDFYTAEEKQRFFEKQGSSSHNEWMQQTPYDRGAARNHGAGQTP